MGRKKRTPDFEEFDKQPTCCVLTKIAEGMRNGTYAIIPSSFFGRLAEQDDFISIMDDDGHKISCYLDDLSRMWRMHLIPCEDVNKPSGKKDHYFITEINCDTKVLAQPKITIEEYEKRVKTVKERQKEIRRQAQYMMNHWIR